MVAATSNSCINSSDKHKRWNVRFTALRDPSYQQSKGLLVESHFAMFSASQWPSRKDGEEFLVGIISFQGQLLSKPCLLQSARHRTLSPAQKRSHLVSTPVLPLAPQIRAIRRLSPPMSPRGRTERHAKGGKARNRATRRVPSGVARRQVAVPVSDPRVEGGTRAPPGNPRRTGSRVRASVHGCSVFAVRWSGGLRDPL